jgi:hypothetical protein
VHTHTPRIFTALAVSAVAFLAAAPAAVHAQGLVLDLDDATGTPVLDLYEDGQLVVFGSASSGPLIAKGAGTRMIWHPDRGAFRAGRVQDAGAAWWDEDSIGLVSAAFGFNTQAAGVASFAANEATRATATRAAAFGYNSTASGAAAFAIGSGTTASGASSFAAGASSQATGDIATAIGYANTASGTYSAVIGNFSTAESGGIAIGGSVYAASGSIALGRHVTTGSFYGSIALGDNSLSPNQSVLTTSNQLAARFGGGYRLYTNGDATTGVTLAPFGSSWASLSDVNAKENFRELDFGHVLDAIGDMSIQEWNYIAGADEVRHIGPTAQEFHAAFGLGSDPLRIETIDADGVALAAIQALIRENRTLVAENETLEDRVAGLAADAEARDARLAELESRLEDLAARLEAATGGGR